MTLCLKSLTQKWFHIYRKNGLIKQFLKDVNWGDLDYLIVDAPPGTSDEHITIAQCLQTSSPADGAVIVTTPQVRLFSPQYRSMCALVLLRKLVCR